MSIKKRILVLSSEGYSFESKPVIKDFVIKKWTPGIFRFIPPNSPYSYVLFWFAHYLKIFKNNSYCTYYIEIDKRPVSSIVCIPPLFIWPFMKKDDIQTKNSYTYPEYRGQGLAYNLKCYTLQKFCSENRTMWCLIHSDNYPSLAVNKKAGLKIIGHYKVRKKLFHFIKIGSIVPIKE